jgi:hypothetical protein
MSRIRIIGLTLVAAFAMSVVGVSSALAAPTLPNMQRCAKVIEPKTGNFEESKCAKLKAKEEWIRVYAGGTVLNGTEECAEVVEPGTGVFSESACAKREAPFEWIRVAPENRKITGTSGAGTLETASGKTVTCTADKSEAEVSGPKKLAKVFVTFTGCASSGVKCNTSGAAAGEIKTKELEGEIGYIEPKANKEVGLDLWPSSRTATEKKNHEFNALFVEFECTGFAKSKVRGSVIGKLTPVNTPTKTLTLTYTKGAAKGEQKLKKLEGVEGGVEDVLQSSLNGAAFEKSSEETTDTNTFGEEVTLAA